MKNILDFEQVLGVALLLLGVFLLVSAALNYAGTVYSSLIVSLEISIGVFLVTFGLYLMKKFFKILSMKKEMLY